ncbi:DNA primase family protein [Rhodococcus triatomae]|nr:phage/plasmid primase [Rhodococcus triatomae BKS 15-14]
MNDCNVSAPGNGDAPLGPAAHNVLERLRSLGIPLSGDGLTSECPATAHSGSEGAELWIHPNANGVVLECADGCFTDDILDALEIVAEGLADSYWERQQTARRNEWPSPNEPHKVALRMLARLSYQGTPTLRYWRGSWMLWEGVKYREAEPTELRRHIYQTLTDAVYLKVDAKGNTSRPRWGPGKTKVSNVLDAMESETFLNPSVGSPSWCGGSGVFTAASTSIICANGILNIEDKTLTPHTPRLFSQISVPFDYDPASPEPVEWLRFLGNIFEHDPDAIHTLQEYIGYILSGRTDLQKGLLLVGPKRAGKGTIFRVLTTLLGGEENVASTVLAKLANNFGLESLIGKPLAIIPDATLDDKNRDMDQIVERLKSMIGEDTVEIPRKYKTDWVGKLGARWIIGANALPYLADASSAVSSRFVVLELVKSFYNQEDYTLGDKLAAEMSGILNWALEGLDRLNRTGRLTTSSLSQERTRDMEDLSSPVSVFVREMCDLDPEAKTGKQQLFDLWEIWRRGEGFDRINATVFGRNLKSAVASIGNSAKIPHPTDPNKRLNAFSGIKPKEDAGERASRVSFGDANFWRVMAEQAEPVSREDYFAADYPFEDPEK